MGANLRFELQASSCKLQVEAEVLLLAACRLPLAADLIALLAA
jgi:hypothetical protein